MGTFSFYRCCNLKLNVSTSLNLVDDEAFRRCSNLTVYYIGSSEEWSNVVISKSGVMLVYDYVCTYNIEIENAQKYYYSETAPTEDGNYWHYDTDGITPVIWVKED